MLIIIAYCGKKRIDISEGKTSDEPIDRVVVTEYEKGRIKRVKSYGGRDAYDRYLKGGQK